MTSAPHHACSSILGLVSSEKKSRNLSYHDVVRSAASGCTLCCILRDAPQPFLEAGATVSDTTNVTVAAYDHWLSVRYDDRPEVQIFNVKDTSIPPIPHSIRTLGDTNSDTSRMRVAGWFFACARDHRKGCATTASGDGLLPDRVLDLESSDGPDIALRETRGVKGAYACLSHCWGKNQPITTTTSTLQHRLKGISFADLPKTFQDAVSFARHMTFRYLWIDSLCIIQDSKEDWAAQSSVMADIYQNAVITLSASGSCGPDTGFFFSTPDLQGINLSSYNHRDDCANIIVRKPVKVWHDKKLHPLLQRAWVYQERLLSPRVLHFGREELIWECMEDCQCECFGHYINSMEWLVEKWYFHRDTLSSLPTRLRGDAWRKAVMDYSTMELSYPNDILLALAGAAVRMRDGMQQQADTLYAGKTPKYLAGMWESDFLEDCLWTTRKPNGVSRPSEWRAPTFSWASVVADHGIKFRMTKLLVDEVGIGEGCGIPPLVHMPPSKPLENHPERLVVLSKLLEAQCVPAPGHTELGQLESGFVVLRGPLLEARLRADEFDRIPDDAPIPSLSDDGDSLWIHIPTVKNPSSFEREFWTDYNFLSTVDKRYYVPLGSRVWVLILLKLRLREGGKSQSLFGLVLKRVSGGDRKDGGGGLPNVGDINESDDGVPQGEHRDGTLHVYERIGLIRLRIPYCKGEIEELFDGELQEHTVVKII